MLSTTNERAKEKWKEASRVNGFISNNPTDVPAALEIQSPKAAIPYKATAYETGKYFSQNLVGINHIKTFQFFIDMRHAFDKGWHGCPIPARDHEPNNLMRLFANDGRTAGAVGIKLLN